MFSQKKGSSYVKEQSKNISKAHKKKTTQVHTILIHIIHALKIYTFIFLSVLLNCLQILE